MKISRVKSRVLAKALDSRKFGILDMYIGSFTREGDEFITTYQDGELGIKLCLQDYCFNEQESADLWKLAEEVIGVKKIDLKILKTVEI